MRRRECTVCWYVYEPSLGDEVWQVPAGTPWEALPAEWRCPRCDAPKERFVDAAEEVDPRVRALVAAYETIAATRMAGLPIVNPRLKVEAVGFREWNGGLLGVLVTPWSINAVLFPPAGPLAPELGWMRELPSGGYLFLPQTIEGIPPLELASIFSPATDLKDQQAAVALARGALDAMLASPKPTTHSRRDVINLLRPREK